MRQEEFHGSNGERHRWSRVSLCKISQEAPDDQLVTRALLTSPASEDVTSKN